MPEMTETQTPGHKPKRKKNKESHNADERHRKEKINAGINRIGNLLPCCQSLKQSKNMILDQAFRYITELKKQNDAMLLEGGDKAQAEEIRRLRRQLEELRKKSAHYIDLLKAHEINFLEDPTIHWKGKQRCVKLTKVTSTHKLHKGIVVYSNGNAMCPTGKQAGLRKQPSETLIVQPAVEARLRVNGTLLQVDASSSTPALLPGSAATPTQSTSGLRVIEQCVVEAATGGPTLPPSVSYITLQIPAATTALPQQTQPAALQTLSIAATSASQLPVESPALLTPLQTVTSGVCSSVAQDACIRTVSYSAVPSSQALLRTGAAGSTQTTWTTLQMAGNTVQPVCQSLTFPEVSANTKAVQQVTACPVQPTVLQPASVVPHPPATLIPQPQPLPQPTLVQQPQATVLPLLQTMQVLQVNPSGSPASRVTASQNANNASVVILQQAGACPPQPVLRDDLNNQTPCQHIVIIQAPNQAPSGTQNPQIGIAPAAVPAVSTQTSTVCTSVSTNTLPSVGGKQLVHILPRPAQPQVTQPSSSLPVSTTPQTFTVNGQVFALQPMKSSDKASTQSGQEFRKRSTAPRIPLQQVEETLPTPSTCQPAEGKLPLAIRNEREAHEGRHSSTVEKDILVPVTSAVTKKDFPLSEQLYTNLDEQAIEHPMTSNRQTDSPLSTGSAGGRVFSVASMLPQGHSLSASASSFGPFTFTSEQAEMLALAILEQDNSGKRTTGCSGDNTSSTTPTTVSWDPTKTPSTSNSKEQGASEQQTKAIKSVDPVTVKPVSDMPVRGQIVEGAVGVPNGGRHPQTLAYSQSQPLSQSQTHSSSQSETGASLSINNLIRSSHQGYPGSPSILGHQGSVSSPLATTAHISQPINNAISPCSGTTQDIEYKKNTLMRAQPGVGMVDRQVKIISKRPAQEEVMLNTGKRPKPCPPPGNTVNHIDGKAPDHSQMMVQLPSTSAAVTPRIISESGGPLFSSNPFTSPSIRPTDGHCPPQASAEQSQSVLHVPQSHPQHSVNQPSQHLGGNLYMKQQHEQQRHHLYHLQHQLTQPDPAQRLSLHQRALQQQEQQQHVQKKRGIVRAGSRGHHSSHLAQQDHLKPGQDHNALQRMMSSRSLEQQLISSPSNPVSRSSDLGCGSSRQERHRVSNYSAEALIGKSSTSGEQQRMALHLQPGRSGAQEQPDLRGYLDTPRGKSSIPHNPQNRLPSDHQGSTDVQRVSECPPFKVMGGGGGTHQLGGFEAQVSRGNEMVSKSVPPSQRAPQGQQQGGFRMSVGPAADSRNRGGYSGPHLGTQGIQVGATASREQESCHQSFMQSLLSPHLPEQTNHQRTVQCCPPVSMEYSCVSGSSSRDIQAKASSPSVPHSQKAPAMRLAEGHKGHIPQVSGNLHAGPGVRAGVPHPSAPHSSSEPGRSSASSRPLTAVSQHSRHIARDTQSTKPRPGERLRSGPLRSTNPFEPESHLPLPSGGGVLLSRSQSGGEARRSTIVRFMPDGAQVPSDNNLVADQHLAQNFGFPFISEGGMNPPPPINANSTFIPPVSQPNTSRTPSLLPVEPQNTLPSFYPSYSPAAHPSLSSDVTLQYFPNQMFTSPSADKGSAPPLNNRFSSILSPPRPVGFAQASFPLLPDIPPMPIANSSSITPHISNFSLTSLFPEIASGMSTDGSAMPMSPLLSLSNTSSADSSKQPNRPAHNISHILGHDGSSAV
ncbi:hypothetical protein OJAV_G00197710 [Oryzias javanicus]|uniref:BHLH domain-containing protein n=1 Tax=Oryzias javanicus TaxID=123683 RepID=A0A437C8J3_ORYJA|nr:hypothetical protein OJAV_G00197710 [Oryzias javanicus]